MDESRFVENVKPVRTEDDRSCIGDTVEGAELDNDGLLVVVSQSSIPRRVLSRDEKIPSESSSAS